MLGGEGSNAPLVERDHELSLVADAMSGLDRSQGSVLLVRGPAGIGKTRLIGAAAAAAGDNGATVLRARGAEVERDAAFGIVRQLLERALFAADRATREEWTAGAAGLSLSIFGTGGIVDRTAVRVEPNLGLIHGIYWLVANMSAARPLVLVVDDAHWSDAPSLRALAYLGRRLEGMPVTVVLAARTGVDDVRDGPLAELTIDPAVLRITLGPLTPAGTEQLVRALATAHVGAGAAAACHQASGGNPFLIGELVFAVEQAGDEVTEAAVADLAKTSADSLTHAIMLRLGVLGPDAVAVARAVSVLDLDGRLSHVAALAGLDPVAAAHAAERLAGARILADATPLAFAHPLLRAAVYHDLSAVQRTLLHERAARVLSDAEVPADRVATHLLATEPGGNTHVVVTLRAAAERAVARGAAGDAVRMLARALDEPPARAERSTVLAELGQAELLADNAQQAVSHLRAALAHEPPPPERLDALLALSQALVATEGHDRAIDALNTYGAEFAGEDALRVDVERTSLALYVAGLGPQAQTRMREYAGLAGETPAERLALATAAVAHAFDPGASVADALPLAHRALGRGRLLAEQTCDAPPFGNACYVLHFAEDLKTFDTEFEGAFADARARGSVFGFMTASLGGAMVAVQRGALSRAVAHGEAALSTWPDLRHTPVAERWISTAVRSLVEALLALGHTDQARSVVAEWSEAGDLDTPMLVMIRYARGLLAQADGHHDRALEDFLAYGAIIRAVGYEDRTTPWRLNAAKASAALGRRTEALRLADEGLEIARTWGAPGGLGAAMRVRALVGDPDVSSAGLAEAVEVLRSSSLRLELAGALVDYGIVLRASGQRRQAREALEQGMDFAARCEAKPLIERAREELVVLGARPRRLMFSGIEALTASERRAGAMATSGLSNREIAQALFVTQKTIENHLASVYRKLDIASRRELPAELAQIPG